MSFKRYSSSSFPSTRPQIDKVAFYTARYDDTVFSSLKSYKKKKKQRGATFQEIRSMKDTLKRHKTRNGRERTYIE